MSGSVFEVLVSAGAPVSAGQEVIVLESMKMEIPVECPEAGTVAEVLVSPEETVEEGQTLLRVKS
ncbi:MAG: acetyl-CoA carboxylase biotin carboxyl carrier protein subunit [Dehalococcoidia bacterium]|nr:acetyl-CoA carboxylase biotin carboxyl carrier protein subunit [Dehalococcoidia bacterium]